MNNLMKLYSTHGEAIGMGSYIGYVVPMNRSVLMSATNRLNVNTHLKHKCTLILLDFANLSFVKNRSQFQ